jgi:hypothetical protein
MSVGTWTVYLSFCPSSLAVELSCSSPFEMVATDIAAAASQAGTVNLGALTAGSYLRVVAATIVIYEYVSHT